MEEIKEPAIKNKRLIMLMIVHIREYGIKSLMENVLYAINKSEENKSLTLLEKGTS